MRERERERCVTKENEGLCHFLCAERGRGDLSLREQRRQRRKMQTKKHRLGGGGGRGGTEME